MTITSFGCNYVDISPGSSGYKEISIKRGLARFSFEYPFEWSISPIEIRGDHTIFSIYGEGHSESTIWSFLIEPVSQRKPSAEVGLENTLSDYAKRLDFDIIERSEINILSGILGYQAIFTYSLILAPPGHGGSGGPPQPRIDRTIYFKHNNLIWNLDTDSGSDVFEKDDIYFEHMLDTFKFLD